jgi:hypothetical protein
MPVNPDLSETNSALWARSCPAVRVLGFLRAIKKSIKQSLPSCHRSLTRPWNKQHRHGPSLLLHDTSFTQYSGSASMACSNSCAGSLSLQQLHGIRPTNPWDSANNLAIISWPNLAPLVNATATGSFGSLAESAASPISIKPAANPFLHRTRATTTAPCARCRSTNPGGSS